MEGFFPRIPYNITWLGLEEESIKKIAASFKVQCEWIFWLQGFQNPVHFSLFLLHKVNMTLLCVETRDTSHQMWPMLSYKVMEMVGYKLQQQTQTTIHHIKRTFANAVWILVYTYTNETRCSNRVISCIVINSLGLPIRQILF